MKDRLAVFSAAVATAGPVSNCYRNEQSQLGDNFRLHPESEKRKQEGSSARAARASRGPLPARRAKTVQPPYRGTSPMINRPPPPGPPQGPGHMPTVGSEGEAVSYERGTPYPNSGQPNSSS